MIIFIIVILLGNNLRHHQRANKSVDVPPKSGRRRISYPFNSLSTVSFTNDIFPGSLALKYKKETIKLTFFPIGRDHPFFTTGLFPNAHLCAQHINATMSDTERMSNSPLLCNPNISCDLSNMGSRVSTLNRCLTGFPALKKQKPL